MKNGLILKKEVELFCVISFILPNYLWNELYGTLLSNSKVEMLF